MPENSNSYFSSKARIVSLTICVLVIAAWLASTFCDLGPYCTRFRGTNTHDGLSWRKFLVLRLRSTHFSVELWETPQSQEFTFESDLAFKRHWGVHDFSNATNNWGFIAFEDYQAGIGWVGRPSSRQKPTTFPVTGTTFISVRWWFVAALAAAPTLIYFGRRLLRKPPPAPGICLRCGYDLRATPNQCPECGLPTGTNTH